MEAQPATSHDDRKQRLIRGVVFDLDGVLIDSMPCHASAFEQVLRPFAITDFDYRSYAGWRTRDVLETVLACAGRGLGADAIASLAQNKSRIARELLAATNPIPPEVVSTLRRLSSDYVLALASSGAPESIHAFLDSSGCRALFRSALSGADVTRGKPDPEIFLKSFRALQLPAAECVVVEDAVSGVEAAKTAGAVAIGLAGTCSRERLRDAGADYVIATLADLPAVLSSEAWIRPPEINLENWREFAAPRVQPFAWTVIVPAAGRGSRLGFDRPKILYPVAGRPILEWLLDFCLPNCATAVFVLAPLGKAAVESALERSAAGHYRIVMQDAPSGMGAAVELGLQSVSTEFVAVLWGDQAALRADSVEACLRLHAGPLQPDVTCPMVIRPNPYIHFERDGAGRVSNLRQAREGDAMPAVGESDTGFFCFRTTVLRELLAESRASAEDRGSQTGEFNFLPIIPAAAQSGHVVLTPRLMSLEETIGINTQDDAVALEEFLRRLAGVQPNPSLAGS